MRYLFLSTVLISAATLGGCNEGVLNPQGPVAVAERQILFDSLGIMLAIVIPVSPGGLEPPTKRGVKRRDRCQPPRQLMTHSGHGD